MDFEKSKIENLKRSLYSRNAPPLEMEEHTAIPKHEVDVATSWGAPKSFDFSPEVMKKKNNSFFNKFFIGSVVFFLLSLGVALFVFFGGINMISSSNVDINIVAPTSVSSGEALDIGLSILNSNRTNIDEVNLFINYPAGTKKVGGNNENLTYEQVDLGTIVNSGTSDHTVRALLFGEKDSIKTFTFRLEYKVKGSNATFSKEKTYDVYIGSSPLLLNIEYPKEINSGQEVKIVIDLTSNSSVVVKDSLVKIEYPYGFTYKSSSLKPLRDNSVWLVGDLKNGDKKTLTVSGVLIGQNMEDRSFRVFVGTNSSDSSNDIDTPLVESDITIGIRKSFFGLEVAPSLGLVAQAGQSIQYSINWQNTLPDKILNSTIEATLSGNVFNRETVVPGSGGFFRSTDNTVFWDKNTTPVLADISPGESGRFSLSAASIGDMNTIRSIKNPHVDMRVLMKGDRSGLDSGQISSVVEVVVKIVSQVALTARSYRSVGPFSNIGPIPPKADAESTYTINWVLTNANNDLKNAVVTAELPTGVSWKGEVSPSSENITYDVDTRLVTWEIGNVSYGAGFAYSPKSVYFKVGIIPSVNQTGTTPIIVSEVNASAVDTYTNTEIKKTLSGVTTEYSDPSYKNGDSVIVK